jgi:hypothetical protein
VKNNLDYQPCMKRTCPLQHHDCMNLIKDIDVLIVSIDKILIGVDFQS